MIRKCAILMMADKIYGYVSAPRQPLRLGLTPNAANAHTNAISYSRLWMVWFSNSLQNDRHARCNSLMHCVVLLSSCPLPSFVLLSSSSLDSPGSSDAVSTVSSPVCCANVINRSNIRFCRWLNRYLGLYHLCLCCVRTKNVMIC